MKRIPKIRRFAASDRSFVQAQQVWLVLVAHIMGSGRNPKNPAKIAYGELAKRMGKGARGSRNLRTSLEVVGAYCKMNGLPTLSSLVVDGKTRKPGTPVVVRQGYSVAREQAAAMRTDWFGFIVPTPGCYRKVWETVSARS